MEVIKPTHERKKKKMTKKRALEIKRRRRSSILNVDEESLIKNESGKISI